MLDEFDFGPLELSRDKGDVFQTLKQAEGSRSLHGEFSPDGEVQEDWKR